MPQGAGVPLGVGGVCPPASGSPQTRQQAGIRASSSPVRLRFTVLRWYEEGGVNQTILIIEDEADIMRLIKYILRPIDCTLILAKSGEEGIRLAGKTAGPIHLLVVNVILPGVLGTEVAAAIKVTRPEMKVILIAGKDRGAVSVLQDGWQFLQKPFVGAQLLECIRAALVVKSEGAGG